MEIVINKEGNGTGFKVYEPVSQTLLITENLTEALVGISQLGGDVLGRSDITYHLDSETMKAMIESNVELLKRLKTAPSGFTMASQRFGGSKPIAKKDNNFSGFSRKMGSTFSGASGFKQANKKYNGRTGNKKY